MQRCGDPGLWGPLAVGTALYPGAKRHHLQNASWVGPGSTGVEFVDVLSRGHTSSHLGAPGASLQMTITFLGEPRA